MGFKKYHIYKKNKYKNTENSKLKSKISNFTRLLEADY